MKKIAKVLLVVVILLEGFAIAFLIRSYGNRKVLTNYEKVESINSEMFSIYVDEGDGYRLYEEKNFWPEGYLFDEDSSNCVDKKGNKLTGVLTYNESTRKASVKTNKSTYCNLYFLKASLTFNLGSFKGSTTTNPVVGYHLKWTLKNATQYCVTTSNNSSSCTWTNLTSTESSNKKLDNSTFSIPDTKGVFTYYAFVKNSKFQVSDYDSITYDKPETKNIPKCSFEVVNTNGSISVKFNKSSDAEKWYVGTTNITPQDDSKYTNPSNPSISLSGTYYGYVKNDAGIGSCTIESSVSQTSGCHSTSGGYGGGDGYCIKSNWICQNGGWEQQGEKEVVFDNCGYGSMSSLPVCYQNGRTQVLCECNSTGGGGTITIWTCQNDTSKTYTSQDACDKECGPVAGTCAAGYTREVGGAADGLGGSWALCYKTFSSVK